MSENIHHRTSSNMDQLEFEPRVNKIGANKASAEHIRMLMILAMVSNTVPSDLRYLGWMISDPVPFALSNTWRCQYQRQPARLHSHRTQC